jgi:uncharacterized protein YidB (DUF937 family)
MTLLDQVKNALGGSAAGSKTPSLDHAVAEVIGSGGLNSLVQRFQSAGLGGVIASWIGTGANQPISGDMLHGVLGSEWVQQLAAKTGLPADQLLSQLAHHLPTAVDRLTPDGQLPPAGVAAEAKAPGSV